MTTTLIKYFAVKPEMTCLKVVDPESSEKKIPKFHFSLYSDIEILITEEEEMINAVIVYPRVEFGQTDDNLCILSVLINEEADLKVEKAKKHYADKELIRLEKDELSKEDKEKIEKDLDFKLRVFDSLDDVKAKYPQTAGTFEIVSHDEDGNEVTITHDKMKEATWAL